MEFLVTQEITYNKVDDYFVFKLVLKEDVYDKFDD